MSNLTFIAVPNNKKGEQIPFSVLMVGFGFSGTCAHVCLCTCEGVRESFHKHRVYVIMKEERTPSWKLS